MGTVQPPETTDECDRQLLRTHEQFLRADRRGDVADAADLWNRLEALLDLRGHLPRQRPPVD